MVGPDKDTDAEDEGKKSPKKKREPAINPSPNPDWKAEKPNEIKKLNRKADTIPKFNNTEICIKYQTTGECWFGKGCSRKATHETIPRDSTTYQAFDTWFKSALGRE